MSGSWAGSTKMERKTRCPVRMVRPWYLCARGIPRVSRRPRDIFLGHGRSLFQVQLVLALLFGAYAQASNLASHNNPYSEIRLFVDYDDYIYPLINDTSYRDNGVAHAN